MVSSYQFNSSPILCLNFSGETLIIYKLMVLGVTNNMLCRHFYQTVLRIQTFLVGSEKKEENKNIVNIVINLQYISRRSIKIYSDKKWLIFMLCRLNKLYRLFTKSKKNTDQDLDPNVLKSGTGSGQKCPDPRHCFQIFNVIIQLKLSKEMFKGFVFTRRTFNIIN